MTKIDEALLPTYLPQIMIIFSLIVYFAFVFIEVKSEDSKEESITHAKNVIFIKNKSVQLLDTVIAFLAMGFVIYLFLANLKSSVNQIISIILFLIIYPIVVIQPIFSAFSSEPKISHLVTSNMFLLLSLGSGKFISAAFSMIASKEEIVQSLTMIFILILHFGAFLFASITSIFFIIRYFTQRCHLNFREKFERFRGTINQNFLTPNWMHPILQKSIEKQKNKFLLALSYIIDIPFILLVVVVSFLSPYVNLSLFAILKLGDLLVSLLKPFVQGSITKLVTNSLVFSLVCALFFTYVQIVRFDLLSNEQGKILELIVTVTLIPVMLTIISERYKAKKNDQ